LGRFVGPFGLRKIKAAKGCNLIAMITGLTNLSEKEIAQFERYAIVAALFHLCDPFRMENLKTGDTVRLKSGGPVMTIGAAMSATSYRCDWFSGSTLQHGTFQVEQLEKAEPESKREDSQ
jgi:uncharacterized protein YodC (DUF2158 family)